jgi:hypothetical protein
MYLHTQVKAGFLFSGKGGTGIVIARLPSGGWSAPSCFGMVLSYVTFYRAECTLVLWSDAAYNPNNPYE